jgi:hypothetical protein
MLVSFRYAYVFLQKHHFTRWGPRFPSARPGEMKMFLQSARENRSLETRRGRQTPGRTLKK